MDLRVLHYFLTVAREQSFQTITYHTANTFQTISSTRRRIRSEIIRSWRAQDHIDRRRIIAKTSCSGDHRP